MQPFARRWLLIKAAADVADASISSVAWLAWFSLVIDYRLLVVSIHEGSALEPSMKIALPRRSRVCDRSARLVYLIPKTPGLIRRSFWISRRQITNLQNIKVTKQL